MTKFPKRIRKFEDFDNKSKNFFLNLSNKKIKIRENPQKINYIILPQFFKVITSMLFVFFKDFLIYFILWLINHLVNVRTMSEVF